MTSYRSKFFLLSGTVCASVAKLTRAKHKHLRLSALRFLRACLGRSDEFFNRFFIKNDLFAPIVALAEQEHGRDNLVTSACLEFFEFVRVVRFAAVDSLSLSPDVPGGGRATSKPSSTTSSRGFDDG